MPDFYFLSFEEFSRHCFELAIKIRHEFSDQKIDYVISIQRGGAMMSKMFSDILDVPIATIVVSSYADLQQAKKPFISQDISVDVQGKRVLIVDEICDTGETLLLVREHLQQFSPAAVKTVVMFLRPTAQFQPDFWAAQSGKWVVFPGELVETAKALLSKGSVEKQLADQYTAYADSQGVTTELLNQLGLQIDRKVE